MTFFSRVFDLLPGRRSADQSESTTNTREKSGSDDTDETRIGTDRDVEQQEEGGLTEAQVDNFDRRRNVRTLPPWIHSVKQGEEDDIIDPNARLLPHPPNAKHPHRNHMPIPKPRVQIEDERGRTRRNGPSSEEEYLQHSRWTVFAGASAFPRTGNSTLGTEEWKAANLPDLDAPWAPHLAKQEEDLEPGFWLLSHKKRKAKAMRAHYTLMHNAFVPLLVRLTNIIFCAAALAMGAYIYHGSHQLNREAAYTTDTTVSSGTDTSSYICKQQASSYMAIAVDVVAVIYLFYITKDEYFAPPIGIRATHAKIRLLFLDLLFIVFSAANLSLAFSTLTDQQWACYDTPTYGNNNNVQAAVSTCIPDAVLCRQQKSLCGILLVSTVAWLGTFTVSVLRVIEKITA